MTEGFGPRVNGFDHFNFGDHKSLEKKNKQKNSSDNVRDCCWGRWNKSNTRLLS